MAPEDIVNNALEAIGHPNRISSFFDGTQEAIVARDMWGVVRDALLTKIQPDWARREVSLTPTKTAPSTGYDEVVPWSSVYPDLPWTYEYAVPDDCLQPLSLQPRITLLQVWRPKPMRFRIKPNAAGTNYVILGDDPSPILTYVAKIPDPNLWQDDFAPIMIETMAHRLMPLFGSQAVKQEAMRQEQRKQQEQSDANSGG
jgi:hypothetical protein